MPVTILLSITIQFAKAVYRDHSRTFESVMTAYKQPVMEYAAHNFTIEVIDGARVANCLTQEEFDQTLALKEEGDPE